MQCQRDWLRVAATEVNNVFQEGRLASIIKASGGEDPDVFKRVAPSCCAYCRLLYVSKDGVTPRVFKLSVLIANGSNVGRKAGRPSLKHTGWKPVIGSTHPWCFPAGTLITTERGQVAIENVTTTDLVLTHSGQWRRVTELHRNQWSGWLVNVNGTHVTPAHPFLSFERGWVPAESLQSSDHLIHARSKVFGVESQDGPAFRFEVSRLRGILSSFAGRVVPVSSVNFDGQFESLGSEVNGVDTDSYDGSERKLVCEKHAVEIALQVRHLLGSLNRFGSVQFLRERLDSAANGLVSVLRQSHALFLGGLGHTQSAGFLDAALGYSEVQHVLFDGPSGDAQDLSHLSSGLLVSAVQSGESNFGKVSERPFVSSHVKTLTDKYISTKRKWFSGKVYNLSVFNDESYLANGIVAHNCGCVLTHKPPGFGFDKHGEMIYLGA